MIAEKYAILYAISATVCECMSQSKVLQDNTTYCSSDLRSFRPLGFEIDLSDHRLFSFFFEVLILIHIRSVSVSLSYPPPSCCSLFNSISQK